MVLTAASGGLPQVQAGGPGGHAQVQVDEAEPGAAAVGRLAQRQCHRVGVDADDGGVRHPVEQLRTPASRDRSRDRVAVNNREVGASDFLVRAGAVTLTASGRKAVIRAWERRMTTQLRHPMFDYAVSYRRAVELQARILAAHLIGELPQYEPLVTR